MSADRRGASAGSRLLRLAAFLAGAVPLLGGCGPRSLSPGSVPFPAKEPVFADREGNLLDRLPPCPEPVRVLFLDFPWCPPCGEVRSALSGVAAAVPPGTFRVFRVLVDRERELDPGKPREVAPLLPSPPMEHAGWATELLALPGPLFSRYRVDHGPVVLLLSGDGTVVRRWVGYSPGMEGEIVAEIRERSGSSPPPGR